MHFIPQTEGVIRSPHSKEETLKRMLEETLSGENENKHVPGKKLKGHVNAGEFNIRLNVSAPEKYLPEVHGKILPEEKGSRILLTYRLQPKTRRSLIIWLSLTGMLTVFFIFGFDRWLYGIITFSLGLVRYLLSGEHFSLQVRRTGRLLEKILVTERNMGNRD